MNRPIGAGVQPLGAGEVVGAVVAAHRVQRAPQAGAAQRKALALQRGPWQPAVGGGVVPAGRRE